MNVEINYANPVFSQAIYDAGIRWKAARYWMILKQQNLFKLVEKRALINCIPAYSTAELGHIIPFLLFNEMKIQKYMVNNYKVLIGEKWESYTTEADCRARYLLYLIETRQVTIGANEPDIANISSKTPLPLNP